MAVTVPGPQAPFRPSGRGQKWLARALGVGQLLLVAPMLASIVVCAMVVGVMGLATGAGPAVLLFVLLLSLGPVLGLGLGLLLVRLFELRREPGAFPLACCGLLLGTAVEYFGWVFPSVH